MAGNTLFVTKETEDSEGLCEPLLATLSLLFERVISDRLDDQQGI